MRFFSTLVSAELLSDSRPPALGILCSESALGFLPLKNKQVFSASQQPPLFVFSLPGPAVTVFSLIRRADHPSFPA